MASSSSSASLLDGLLPPKLGELVSAAQGSALARRARAHRDEALASLTWGARALPLRTRVPLRGELDAHLGLALFEVARVLATELSGDPVARLADCPVTLAVAGAGGALFLLPDGVVLADWCLNPYCVLQRRELYRLFSSPLLHVTATHALSNLAAALPDAVQLERSRGSLAFAAELAGLAALSQGAYVCLAWARKAALHNAGDYFSSAAVGFSSIAFALKVIAGAEARGGASSALGLAVPSQWAWVLQLGLTHLAVPEASFSGHMCGIIAGILRAYLLGPMVRAVTPSLGSGGSGSTRSRGGRYAYFGSGTTSGRPVSRGRNASGSRWAELRSGLAAAVRQLAVAGLASGAFWLLRQQQRRRM
jgi:rhomboid domain-containing protein 1